MEKTTIVIVDDHPLVRQAIKNALRNHSTIHILGEANNGVELLALMEDTIPDIAIIDLEMPKMDGYETILQLHTLYPQTKSIAFSGFLSKTNQERIIEMGAFASISKTETSEDFIKAIEAVIKGKPYHSDMLRDFYAKPEEKKVHLTLREKQILSLIAKGKTSKQIGATYNISQWTVNKHRSNIRAKLGNIGLAEMVRYAIENGYITRKN